MRCMMRSYQSSGWSSSNQASSGSAGKRSVIYSATDGITAKRLGHIITELTKADDD